MPDFEEALGGEAGVSADDTEELPAEAPVPYGYPDTLSIYINDVEYDLVSFKVIKKLNQMSSFEVKLYDVTQGDANVQAFKDIKLFAENTLVLKGRIQKVTFTTDGYCNITGWGKEILLFEKEISVKMTSSITTTDNKRQEFDTAATDTIVNEICSMNGDGIAPWDLQPNTNTNGGTPTVRFENANKLQAVAGTAAAANSAITGLGYDWWVSHAGADYSTDYINVDLRRGSAVSLMTFEVSGANQNAVVSDRQDDVDNMANYIVLQGYGDGVNQLTTTIYNSSPTYTFINSDVVSTAVAVTVASTAAFAASGTIIIGTEQIIYTSKGAQQFNVSTDSGTATAGGAATLTDGAKAWGVNQWTGYRISITAGTGKGQVRNITSNTATVITVSVNWDTNPDATSQYSITGRGANSTTPALHKLGVYVQKYVVYTAPEANSSILTNGLQQKTVTAKEVIALDTLEIMATRLLMERLNPIARIVLTPGDIFGALETVDIGDTITITDSDSGLSGTYRYVGLDLELSEDHEISMRMEVSNVYIQLLQQMDSIKKTSDAESIVMQGATNAWQVSVYENCDNTKPLNLRFFLPNEAVGVNKITLTFKMKNYRAYESTNASTPPRGVVNGLPAGHCSGTNPDFISLAIPDVFAGGTWGATEFVCFFLNQSGGAENPMTLKLYANATLLGSTGALNIPNNTFIAVYFREAGVNYWGQTGKFETSGVVTNAADMFGIMMFAEDTHTHTINYGIKENTAEFTPPGTVTITVGPEGEELPVSGSPFAADQTNLDLTNAGRISFSGGNWYNVKIVPTAGGFNGRMRIEANLYIQCFLKSRSV